MWWIHLNCFSWIQKFKSCIVIIMHVPMIVKEGDPVPSWLVADIDMLMFPFPAFSEQGGGLIEGTVQISCTQDDAEMVSE